MQREGKTSGKNGANGSITIFLSLTLLLVLSFLFSLLEAARVAGLGSLANQKLQIRLESAFGAYNRPMWDRYGLLYLDGSHGTDQLDLKSMEGRMMEEAMQSQAGEGFLRLNQKNIQICGYTLATDDGGKALEQQACARIQKQLADHVRDSVLEQLKEGSQLWEGTGTLKEKWGAAKEALEEADNRNTDGETLDQDGEVQEPGDAADHMEPVTEENPIPFVENLRQSGILGLVVEQPERISNKAVLLQDCVENRAKYSGNMQVESTDIVDKLWFLLYLNQYFSSMGDQGEGEEKLVHALDYELEYCVCAEESDQENLRETVNRLLILREAGNFAALMKSSGKRAAALELATAIVGFTGIVPLIQAVQIGILLAWSFVESILDIRCLLAGGKIALIKKETEFQCGTGGLREVMESEGTAREEEKGLTYRQYLMILLAVAKEEAVVFRAMDVMEQNIRREQGYEQFRMDTQVLQVEAEGTYTAISLFPSVVTLVKAAEGTYVWNKRRRFSY